MKLNMREVVDFWSCKSVNELSWLCTVNILDRLGVCRSSLLLLAMSLVRSLIFFF